uniref:mannose-1-phosphate guanylyltransferase n=1 Tax=Tetraselmis sp. GSL018 TaxID=582737 RepID=A0A061S4D2_9CHLO|mmetsp:Transcript_6368/g.15301  ORF Transcript_6368/g.15301 Transcript_6368/m.15301 type:complete len:361 (+) Transcript_6368:137-1219(+)|eukprot:CAMPEP_0177606360 /NCGR_PEP_ID=MMETSP0419_2-20121207/17263_1 /TAXON_ID=582737 /ORGANISM="Tetraselmis sp., Strain GSL018" /LENGTH=360 /DNA_ID=CAMNT_0019100711 /DNA_START=121 /DNA_END=1203 /DNA_ORIENTATION=-
MKAVILVGGFGTRLRPLTLTVPKPLVDFANKPMIVHQIEALRDAGVDKVVLAINYRPTVMKQFIQEWESKVGVKIVCSQEEEPMGTAGPLALARKELEDGSNEPFFVLNSDVICEYPLREMLEFHKSRGAEGTLLVTQVADPSKYGVVVMDESGLVDRFVEKPQVFVGDKINAGIYVLSPSVLDRIELRPTSIEKEIFPSIASDKKLFAMILQGYWMDVGQPKDYLTGLTLHLSSVRKHRPEALSPGDTFQGNVLVEPSVKIGEGCLIGPDVCIGTDCVIGNGVRLRNCVLMSGTKVKDYSQVINSIIGWYSSVGKWSRVENGSVIGEDVHLKDEVYVNGGIVLPHKEIKESITSPQIIM